MIRYICIDKCFCVDSVAWTETPMGYFLQLVYLILFLLLKDKQQMPVYKKMSSFNTHSSIPLRYFTCGWIKTGIFSRINNHRFPYSNFKMLSSEKWFYVIWKNNRNRKAMQLIFSRENVFGLFWFYFIFFF